jgi:type I restriction enzyme S subunit
LRTTSFTERTWEMYVACVLLKKEFPLVLKKERPKKKGGPDIQIKVGKNNIWIESVVAERGTEHDAVPEVIHDTHCDDWPEEQILLRATNALATKFKQHKKHLEKNIVGVNDIYIVAVNFGGIH